jgi:dTDP-4-amino-4,6-dideoxygalactose transaminase
MKEIKFHKPNIDNSELKNLKRVIKSGWLTTGAEVKKFEKEFLKIFKKKLFCTAINSCTSGLFLALKAIGIKKNDEVITSDLTFTSTVSSIYHTGAKPVIVDIEKDSLNMSIDEIKKKITKKTKCIIVVHYSGYPVDIEKIYKIAKKKNIKIIEDAAHCLPSRYKNDLIGEKYSDVSVFSFYATKTLTTGEGGMCLSKHKKIIDYIKTNSFHGIDRDVYNRYNQAQNNWFYDVKSPGYKFNLTDLSASMGISQLKKLKKNYNLRKKISDKYFEILSKTNLILPIKDNKNFKSSWHLFVIRILSNNKINRDKISNLLKKKGIGSSVHYVPIHKHTFWKKNLGLKSKNFENTEIISKEILSLPIYPDLKLKDVKKISQMLVSLIQ